MPCQCSRPAGFGAGPGAVSVLVLMPCLCWCWVDALQAAVDAAYKDQKKWTRMSILSAAGMGKFSTDRTIAEYAKDIWWVTWPGAVGTAAN